MQIRGADALRVRDFKIPTLEHASDHSAISDLSTLLCVERGPFKDKCTVLTLTELAGFGRQAFTSKDRQQPRSLSHPVVTDESGCLILLDSIQYCGMRWFRRMSCLLPHSSINRSYSLMSTVIPRSSAINSVRSMGNP